MREGPGVRALWRFAQILLATPVLYLAAAFLVFDFAGTAWARTQEYGRDGRRVAHGPFPRRLLCRGDYPHWQGDDFSGQEWPFRLFQPVCRLWLRSQELGRADREP